MRGAVTIAAVLAGLVLLPLIAFAAGSSRPAGPPQRPYHPHPRPQQQTAPSQPI
jgi:hypothetical protein